MAMRIYHGSHTDSLVENCVMEHVCLLYLADRGIDTGDLLGLKTDTPGCTAPWIIFAAIDINDRLHDDERQRLSALIPRLLHDARMPADARKQLRVRTRVNCWALRTVVDLAEEPREMLSYIEKVERWLEADDDSPLPR